MPDLTTDELPDTNLFTEALPQLPKAWDSTMLGLLKECPRKFQYVILEGWQPHGFATHLVFGIAYHAALEGYDKDRAEGLDHHTAYLNAIKFCMNYGERTPEGKFKPYDHWFTNEPTKTRETLTRSVAWYLDFFKDDPLKTVILSNGKPAVELSFKLQLDLMNPDGEPYILAGHLDRLVEANGHYHFLDRKTTKGQLDARYWKQFNPSNQMSLYDFASSAILKENVRGGYIDAAQMGVSFTRFKRHPISRTPGLQAEWLNDTYLWIGMAAQFAAEGYWPMNDKSCGNYGGCPFQIICSRDPKVRPQFLKHEGYHKRKWNPLESR